MQKLRLELGMTQAELAELADMSPSYVARIEANIGSRPRRPALARLARALGVPATALQEVADELPREVLKAYRETPDAVLWFAGLSKAERKRHAAKSSSAEEKRQRDRVKQLARKLSR